MAAAQDLGLSVVTHFGAKPCFFSSFRSNQLADLAQRRGWTKKSSTPSSTALHNQCFRPRTLITIASRCQRALAARTAAAKIDRDHPAKFQKSAPQGPVRRVNAALAQQVLDITKRQ